MQQQTHACQHTTKVTTRGKVQFKYMYTTSMQGAGVKKQHAFPYDMQCQDVVTKATKATICCTAKKKTIEAPNPAACHPCLHCCEAACSSSSSRSSAMQPAQDMLGSHPPPALKTVPATSCP
mgnify:CR=1 FL=1